METTLSLHLLDSSTHVVSIDDYDQKIKQGVWRVKLKRMALQGMKQKDMARELGLSLPTIGAIVNDPSFRKEVLDSLNGVFADVDDSIKEQQKTLHERMEGLAHEAFGKLERILMADNSHLTDYQRAKLCEGVLDRTLDTARISKSAKLPTPDIEATDLVRASQGAREMEQALQLKRRA